MSDPPITSTNPVTKENAAGEGSTAARASISHPFGLLVSMSSDGPERPTASKLTTRPISAAHG